MFPTNSEINEEELAQEDLPRFGASEEIKFIDPLQEQHDEIDGLVNDLVKDEPQTVMMSNNDSFSNIAPGGESDKKQELPTSNIEELNLNEKSIHKEDLKKTE